MSYGSGNRLFRICTFSSVTGRGRQLLTSHLGHRRTITRGIPLPKFVPEEYLQWKVRSVVIRVLVIDCLRYQHSLPLPLALKMLEVLDKLVLLVKVVDSQP